MRAERQRPSGRATRMFLTSRARAKSRGLEFSLTREFIEAALLVGRCQVTGLPFWLGNGRGKHPLAPSVDRIDSSRGYTPDNVRIVCWAVNCGASSWGLDVYLAVAAHALGVPNASAIATINQLQESP